MSSPSALHTSTFNPRASTQPLIVLKFGGSVLGSEDDLRTATHEVYSWVRRGWKVLAVVSAFEGVTDSLVSKARQYGDQANPAAAASRALLTGTGELTSASLLGLALDRAGVAATVAAPWTIGLTAEGEPLDAFLKAVDGPAVDRLFADNDALVVPGFVGIDAKGQLVLLGRGGSDLSALFLAERLGADKCRLIKDVDGLYEFDPALAADGKRQSPRRFSTLPWSEALKLDGGIVQHKAIRFAADRRLRFEVGAALQSRPTLVGDHPVGFAPATHIPDQPLRVALLGCGTVGLGVYQLLSRFPDRFEVIAVAVRDRAKAQSGGVAPGLITTDPISAASSGADLVIELLGGLDPAADAITAALHTGSTVITANKAALAARADDLLWRRAIESGRLRHSAAVGGAAPLLEAVERIAEDHRIVRLEGVINGTTNSILEQVAAGRTFDQALVVAQAKGLAEADPSRDLEGLDVVDKLVLLARCAWGVNLDPARVQRTPLNERTLAATTAEAAPTHIIRYVASITRTAAGIVARVAPRAVDPAEHLARVPGSGNLLVVTTRPARTALAARTSLLEHVVRGTGAGRWPTAEAVIADVLAAAAAHEPARVAPDPVGAAA